MSANMKGAINFFITLFSIGLLFPTLANASVATTRVVTKTTENRSGLFAVASRETNGSTDSAVDISVSSENNIQMVTITTTADGAYRIVLTNSDGQILSSRNVEGEAALDFYSLPNGTYKLAILSGDGDLVMHQTLLKR
jgi:hypothetical protein